MAQPHDWWESASAGPLEFEAPPGAYVVCVETADQSHLEPLKRLLIVSDLAAVAWVGSEQAVIWGGKNPLSTTAPEGLATLTGDFWMAGSFVPRSRNSRPAWRRWIYRPKRAYCATADGCACYARASTWRYAAENCRRTPADRK